MEIHVPFTARQLEFLREARDADAPNTTIEEYIAQAYGADAKRGPLDLVDHDELD